jgi:hypothetical protein
VDPQRHSENFGQGLNGQGLNGQGMKFHAFSDRNVRRGGYPRNSGPGNLNVNSYLLIYFVYFCFILVPLDKVLQCSALVFGEYDSYPLFLINELIEVGLEIVHKDEYIIGGQ